MRSSFAFVGLLLQAGLTVAKPYLYEKDGMVYNVLPREETLTQNDAAVEAREMSLEQANVAESKSLPKTNSPFYPLTTLQGCLDSYNLIATGSGPYPTGNP